MGQTFPATLAITNASTDPVNDPSPLQITLINHVPACPTQTPAANCSNAVPEVGVFGISATGVGAGAVPSCQGTWTIFEVSPGVFRFEPQGGEGTLFLATGETCLVNFTATTLRVPTTDIDNVTPNTQTLQLATVVPRFGATTFPANSGPDITTVLQADPTLTTDAAQSSATVPGTTTDVATLTAPPGAVTPPSPVSTITFDLYGPADPNCLAAPIFTSVVPVDNGFGPYFLRPRPHHPRRYLSMDRHVQRGRELHHSDDPL